MVHVGRVAGIHGRTQSGVRVAVRHFAAREAGRAGLGFAAHLRRRGLGVKRWLSFPMKKSSVLIGALGIIFYS